MSYDNNIAHMELEQIIQNAVRTDDDETLHKWASIVAETDEEYAYQIRSLAVKAENNNWAHDRARDNNN